MQHFTTPWNQKWRRISIHQWPWLRQPEVIDVPSVPSLLHDYHAYNFISATVRLLTLNPTSSYPKSAIGNQESVAAPSTPVATSTSMISPVDCNAATRMPTIADWISSAFRGANYNRLNIQRLSCKCNNVHWDKLMSKMRKRCFTLKFFVQFYFTWMLD